MLLTMAWATQPAAASGDRTLIEGLQRRDPSAMADLYDQLFLEAGLADAKKTYPDQKHPVVIPYRVPGGRHVFHQYVIRAKDRDALKKFLAEEGVGTEVYYPLPLHLQSCFHAWGGREGEFPEAERAAREVLALPIYPELPPHKQTYVVSRATAFYRS